MSVVFAVQRRAQQLTYTVTLPTEHVTDADTLVTLQHVSIRMTTAAVTHSVISAELQEQASLQTIHTITHVIQHVMFPDLQQEQHPTLTSMDVALHVVCAERQNLHLTAMVLLTEWTQHSTGRNVSTDAEPFRDLV